MTSRVTVRGPLAIWVPRYFLTGDANLNYALVVTVERLISHGD